MKIDYILVEKSKRTLTTFSGNAQIKIYSIDLGTEPVGHKQFEGDQKTPEGLYTIDGKNPKSSFFLNLGISYPSASDIEYATSKGLSPGGFIKIHGQPNEPDKITGYPKKDWTQGCIALSNIDMLELYKEVEIGTRIEIRS